MEQASHINFFDHITKNINDLNKIDSNPLIGGLNSQLQRLKEGISNNDKSDNIKEMIDSLNTSLGKLHQEESLDKPNDQIKGQLYDLKLDIITRMQKDISDYFVVVGDEIYINTKKSVIHNMDNRIQKNAGEPGILGSFIKSLSS